MGNNYRLRYVRQLVMLLLQFGADMHAAINCQNRYYTGDCHNRETPWMLAIKMDRPELFELFVDNGLLDILAMNRDYPAFVEFNFYTQNSCNLLIYSHYYDGTVDDAMALWLKSDKSRTVGLLEYCITNRVKNMLRYFLDHPEYSQTLMPYTFHDPYLAIKGSTIFQAIQLVSILIEYKIYPTHGSIRNIMQCFDDNREDYDPELLKLMLQYCPYFEFDNLQYFLDSSRYYDKTDFDMVFDKDDPKDTRYCEIRKCYQLLLTYGHRINESDIEKLKDNEELKDDEQLKDNEELKDDEQLKDNEELKDDEQLKDNEELNANEGRSFTGTLDEQLLNALDLTEYYQKIQNTRKQHQLVIDEFLKETSHYLYRPSSIGTRILFLKYELSNNNIINTNNYLDLLRYLSLDLNVSPKELLDRLLLL
jgi:hypothetical protein